MISNRAGTLAWCQRTHSVLLCCAAGGSLQANDFPELGGQSKATRQRMARQQAQMRGTMAQRLGPPSAGGVPLRGFLQLLHVWPGWSGCAGLPQAGLITTSYVMRCDLEGRDSDFDPCLDSTMVLSCIRSCLG